MMQRSDCRPITIVSIDLCGYSRLMERDEAGTHQAMMRCNRDILEPTIANYRGSIVKSTGDGALIVFPDPAAAVWGMIRFQRHVSSTFGHGHPIETGLRFRVGMHFSTAIFEDGDLYGNGVNLAVRLQEAAEPGSILVSEALVDQLSGMTRLQFRYAGTDELKNIEGSIPLYQWNTDHLQPSRRNYTDMIAATAAGLLVLFLPTWSFERNEGTQRFSASKAWSSSDHRTEIAILPFTYRDTNSGLEQLVERLPDRIADDLANNPRIVVSRERSHDMSEQRDVYALEGTVRDDRDRIRIHVQLRNDKAGRSLWSEEFDRVADDAGDLDRVIARRIASSIAMTMHSSERIVQSRSENAYNAYLRALTHYDKHTPHDLSQAVRDLEEALTWDPGYDRAHALLAAVHWTSWQNHWRLHPGTSTRTALGSVQVHLKNVLEPIAIAHGIRAEMSIASGRYGDAIVEAEKAIVLEPKSPFGYYAKGLALTFAGRPQEAVHFIRTALQINPHGQRYLFGLALADYGMEHFNSALRTLEQATRRNPEDDWPFLLLAATYGQLHWADEAEAAVERFDALSMERRGWSSDHLPYVISWPFRYDRDRRRLHQGMVSAGIKPQFRVAIRQ